MELPAEWFAAYVALRETWPHMLRWAPKIKDFVSGRQAAAAAAAVNDAQAVHLRAQARAVDVQAVVSNAQAAHLRAQAHAVDVQADAQASATWAALNASLIGRLEKVEKAEKECQDRATAIERRAEERERVLRKEAAAEHRALRAEMAEALVRAHQRATPRPPGLRTVLDPLETPPDGHRLSAPSLPTREDTDPTPDLHTSVTPSRAKTDPPSRD